MDPLFLRIIDLTEKRRPIPEIVKQSQSNGDSFDDALVLGSNSQVLDAAGHSQPNIDAGSPDFNPSSSDVNIADETQFNDDLHQPLELISCSPTLDHGVPVQVSDEFNQQGRTAELDSRTEFQFSDYPLNHCPELLPNSPNNNSAEWVHSHGGSQYHWPNLITSSPDVTPDGNQSSDSGHQPPERISKPSIMAATEHSLPNNECLHPIGLDLSSIGPDPDHIQLDVDSPQPSEPVSTLQIDDAAKQAQFSEEASHRTLRLVAASSTLDASEELSPQGQMLPSSGLFSSSPGIGTPDDSETGDESLRKYPEFMRTPSLVHNIHEPPFDECPLHSSLEVALSSPTILSPENPRYDHDSSHQIPEPISKSSILDIAAPQPQFSANYLQQTLQAISASLIVNTASQSSDDDEKEDDLSLPLTVSRPSPSDEEDEDLSPLEYARKNGLSRDYFTEPYLISNLDMPRDCQEGVSDHSHLPQLSLSGTVNTDERLTISKEAALLIASVSRQETSEWADSIMLQMIGSRKNRNLRLELPLLKSDHETDCKRFAKREGFEIQLKNVKLPLEVVDEETNGGLTLLASLWNKGTEMLDELKRERLEVSKDTLVRLQNILKNDWAEEDEKTVWASVQMYRKNIAREPVTPPLSPMSFPVKPFEPSMSDPVFELPILSDPESLTKEDLEAIEKQIFEDDVPTPIKKARNSRVESSDTLVGSDKVKLGDIYSPAASLDKPSISPDIETKRVKRQDMKVEETLTPAKSIELPKYTPFGNEVMEWPIAAGSPIADPFESAYFEEAFGGAHEKATRMSEQEALIPVDTLGRVDVPVMDFTLPDPPWKAMNTNSNRNSLLGMQKSIMNNIIGQGFPKWPASGKYQIRYNPFPHDLAKVALNESFVEDDSTWQAFVKGPKDDEVTDTFTLTLKPPGLRILRDKDDDDEIEPGQFGRDVPQDLLYLVKKRKIELEERGGGEDSIAQEYLPNMVPRQPPTKKTPKPSGFISAVHKSQMDASEKRGSLLTGGAFSVGNSVGNFLEIRGKKLKLCKSSYFTETPAISEAQPAPAKPNTQPDLLMQLPIRLSPAPKTDVPLPAPPSNVLNVAVNVIVASTLLKHRALIKHIEALLPKMLLVERDLSAHDTTVWMPNSVSRSPITSPLASEADIIVSPLVGIIIATLQKIKQKPLPGQKTKSAIRDRLEKVSARYEKLIVLVTEGRQDETTRELDDSDCTAFSEFVGFAQRLETAVNVQFVGGGEAALAKWLVSAITRHKIEEELLTDETHWELFLRRAGLNAFAAQHIISALKAPDNVDLSSPGNAALFGLTVFVEMGREQRVARLGPMCGNRLMARVSAVVDARWS